MGRKQLEVARGSDGVAVSAAQYSYNDQGLPECTAVRMNPSIYASLPASACTLGTQGSHGPDRITKNVYDAAGQLLQVRKAVGTPVEIADVTYTYTPNGNQKFVIDANGNRAELRYDGHDRLNSWVFPSKTKPTAYNDATPASALSSSRAPNEGDYEAYTDDANGNRLTHRKRDGTTLGYQYDALNRVIRKTVPERSGLPTIHTRDVFYYYDLRGLQTAVRFGSGSTSPGVASTYDGFGRLVSETQSTDGTSRTVSSQYDANGNRTRVTHPDGHYWQFDYDGLDRATALRYETTVLGTASFNARGLLSQRAWTYGTASNNGSSFGYDDAGRLASIALDVDGSSSDVSWAYTRNPASQIRAETRSNDAYAWDGHVNVNRAYATNGLNQCTTAGPAAFCYDANGNLTADGSSVYLYDVENRLVERRVQTNANCAALSYAGALEAALYYDPLGRLYLVRDWGGRCRIEICD
ncbi:hypothetical protein [Pelagerythrobacter sp.]|uniref:hypothetical protein n=1 Tax=Pelagerythrobacter sp. TaxID=2800702 RepID=UPI0035B418CF